MVATFWMILQYSKQIMFAMKGRNDEYYFSFLDFCMEWDLKKKLSASIDQVDGF